MKLSGIIVNILKWDFWLKDGIAPVSRRHSLSPARRSLSPLVRDRHHSRRRFGRPFAHPATKVDGAGTKMTGPPSSSYPGQVPPPAAVVSPENEEKSSGFDRKFAGFVLRRPAAIFGDEDESTSVIPPPRLFKALVLEADTLIPKIAPQAVKSAEIVEGDGGVGTIKKISFGEGSHYSYVKHRIDGLDKDNFVYSYSLVEGDALSDKVEKISYEIKLVASADGGSIIKSTSNYHTKGDVEIKEEDVKAGKEKATGLFKLIENYLVANPDAYN